MQSIPMQIKRLERIVDGLYNRSESVLGNSDIITKQALKALVFLQGLKYDVEAEAEAMEAASDVGDEEAKAAD